MALFLLSICGSEQSSALRHSYICGIGVGQTYFPKNDVFIDEFMEPLLQTLLPVIFVYPLEVSIVFQYIGDMHRIHCWENSPPPRNAPLLHGNTLHCILTPKFKNSIKIAKENVTAFYKCTLAISFQCNNQSILLFTPHLQQSFYDGQNTCLCEKKIFFESSSLLLWDVMMIFPTTKLIHDLTWAPWSWEERAFLSRASGQVLSKYQCPCRTGPPWSDEEEIDALSVSWW